MPPKKRPSSACLSPKKTAVSDEQYMVVTVALETRPEVQTFVVPMSALGDDRWDIEDMLEFGLRPEEAVFVNDATVLPEPGMQTLLRRLGLRLGVLSPSQEPEDDDERALAGTLAKTKQKRMVSYRGPAVAVLGMRVTDLMV